MSVSRGKIGRLAVWPVAIAATLVAILSIQAAGPVERASACVVTVPANVTKSNDPNQAGAVTTYAAPTTSGGDCGTITCSPASGSFFPVGTTEVTCSASGDPGSRDSFLIKVNDTQPPSITAPANVTAGNDPGLSTAFVTFPPPVASDNAPGVTASCNRPFESHYKLGTTQVICTARDSSGNTATASFSVIVKDIEAPTISAPLVVSALASPGATGATVGYNVAAHDNSGQAVTPACTPPSGSSFPVGKTTVQCTAKDAAANAAIATFDVTVIGQAASLPTTPLVPPAPRIHLALVQGGRLVYAISTDAKATIDLRRCGNRACTKSTSVAVLTQDAKEGRNSVKIPKRNGGKAIANGRYLAVVSATGATGDATPLTLRFKLQR